MKIAIRDIKINPGRREASLSGIDELARSIFEVGLLNPITIAPDYTLIAGLHRLEAAKRLGWTDIECTIYGLEGLQAKLAEIDENVVRTALSTIEYGELLERRKELYESLYPETKAALDGFGFLLSDYRTMIHKIGQQISFYHDSYFKNAVSALSQAEMDELEQLTDSCCEMMQGFVKQLKDVVEHPRG